MTMFDWIVIGLLGCILLAVAALLFVSIRIYRYVLYILDLLTSTDETPVLQSSISVEQPELEQPPSLVDVLLGRKGKASYDPADTGTFKGRQGWL